MATKTLVDTDSVQTLSNKTFLDAGVTLTQPNIVSPTISNPVLSGTVTGTYTLDGAVTLDNPVVVGTITGTYTIGGTPTGTLLQSLSTGATTARSLGARGRDVLSVKDFGAVGDGAVNDTTSIQAAFDYITANGGVLFFPAGTYNLTSGILITSAALPFSIIGAGTVNTTIKRFSNFAASVIELRSANDWRFENMTIDANHSVYSGGDHGFVFRDCNRAYIGRLFVTNHKNSGILGLSVTDGVATHGDNVIENCTVDGLTVGLIGIMVANQYRTRFINCVVKNIDPSGGPGYGIQFKNNCTNCVMINPMVYTARAGIVISNDLIAVGTDVGQNRVYGGFAYNCSIAGLYFAGVNYAQGYDVLIHGANAGNDACVMDNATHSSVRVSSIDIPSAKGTVKFSTNASDNTARITTMSNPTLGVINFATIVGAGSVRNSVYLDKVTTPVSTSASSIVSNSGDNTNIFVYNDLELRFSETIATGVITLKHGKVRWVQADTEAAAATDDLDTISAGNDYTLLTLHTANNARDIVVKHNTGNILLSGAVDFTLNNSADTITLMYRTALTKWVEVGRGDNGV